MKLNLANKLTVGRMICVPVFAVFAALAVRHGDRLWYGMALMTFVIASITDMLDGMVARKYNMITKLGQFLDPLADKLLTTVAFLYMLKGGVLSFEVVCILIVRELVVSAVRMISAGSVDKAIIPANMLGKAKTVLMMAMIIIFYAGMAFAWSRSWVRPTVRWMSWACVAVSIASGISYIFCSKDAIKDAQ